MKRIGIMILIVSLVSGCATLEKSALLGAGIGVTAGTGVGLIADQGASSVLIGAGIGILAGAGFGLLGFVDKQDRDAGPKLQSKEKTKTDRSPALTSPEVRRIWVPEKSEGGRLEEGHYLWIIEKPSVWAH